MAALTTVRPSSTPPRLPSHIPPIPKATVLSPDVIALPNTKHYVSGMAKLDKQERNYVQKKAFHTVAPDSAEKQAAIFQRNYRLIRAHRHSLGSSHDQRVFWDKRGAKITVTMHDVTIVQAGKTRSFQNHKVQLPTGETRVVGYPSGGTGVRKFLGPSAITFMDKYKEYLKTNPTPPLPFHDWCDQQKARMQAQASAPQPSVESKAPTQAKLPGKFVPIKV